LILNSVTFNAFLELDETEFEPITYSEFRSLGILHFSDSSPFSVFLSYENSELDIELVNDNTNEKWKSVKSLDRVNKWIEEMHGLYDASPVKDDIAFYDWARLWILKNTYQTYLFECSIGRGDEIIDFIGKPDALFNDFHDLFGIDLNPGLHEDVMVKYKYERADRLLAYDIYYEDQLVFSGQSQLNGIRVNDYGKEMIENSFTLPVATSTVTH
jgi:hypothetical protein